MNDKRGRAFWAALALTAAISSGRAWAAPSDALLGEEELEFDQLYAQLEHLTPEELLADMERAYLLLDQSGWEDKDNALIPWGAAMADRIDEFTEEQLADAVLDEGKDLYFRGAIVQLRELRRDAAQADPRLYQLLEDRQAPEYLRTTLLLHLDFEGPERQALLERLAAGQDSLAAYAQKKMGWDSRETVYQSRIREKEAPREERPSDRAGLWGLLAAGAGGLAAAWVFRRLPGRLFRELEEEEL